MTGPEANLAFLQAVGLVKEGRYEEALAVKLLPSDRKVIEARIAAAKHDASANTTEEKR